MNLHSCIASITFGPFMVPLFATFMFLTARKHEDRAYYDWMAFIGSFIGAASLTVLPLAGCILAEWLFLLDAAIVTGLTIFTAFLSLLGRNLTGSTAPSMLNTQAEMEVQERWVVHI